MRNRGIAILAANAPVEAVFRVVHADDLTSAYSCEAFGVRANPQRPVSISKECHHSAVAQHSESIDGFDMALLDWLHRHATPTGYAIFHAITLLGSPVTLTVLALGVGLLLAIRRQWILLGGWLTAFVGGGLLDEVLKLVIRRPRPPYAAAFLQHYSWSFPSGHAMGSLIGYGMLAYVLGVLWIHRRSAQISVVLGAALLIVAIGFSRLYLGVHYFSDVVGGYAAGLLWLSACISGLEVARRWRAGARPAAAPPTPT